MLNFFILNMIGLSVILGAVTCIAEMFTEMNTPIGRKFRAVRIRLREISVMNLCVTSLLLLFWGAVFGDDNFGYIFTAVSLLMLLYFIVHIENFYKLKRQRKKAFPKNPAPLCTAKVPMTAELCELVPLEPKEISPQNGETSDKQKG